ncbi:hypothetical protein CKO17_12135 [Marichromatium gracile]|nr:hypothetical protein [Marichromatium gracile]
MIGMRPSSRLLRAPIANLDQPRLSSPHLDSSAPVAPILQRTPSRPGMSRHGAGMLGEAQ